MTRCTSSTSRTLLHLVHERVPIDPSHQLVAPQLDPFAKLLAFLLESVNRGELAEREALVQMERMTEVEIRLLGDRVSRRAAGGSAREPGLGDATLDANTLPCAGCRPTRSSWLTRGLAALCEGLGGP